jgi:hypothetical protein
MLVFVFHHRHQGFIRKRTQGGHVIPDFFDIGFRLLARLALADIQARLMDHLCRKHPQDKIFHGVERRHFFSFRQN